MTRTSILSMLPRAFIFTVQWALVGQVNPLGGIISGTVTEQGAKPVPAALVSLVQIGAGPEKGQAIAPKSAYSGKEGSFFFMSLPPGQYRVCAKLVASTLLDPCDWETKQVLYPLKAGQLIANLKLVLKQGVVLPIRLEDPSNHMSANQGAAGSHVLIGIPLPNGMFLPATPVSSPGAKGGLDHQILVPPNTDLKVVVASARFQLSDPSGKPMRDGASGPTIASSSNGNIQNRGNFTVRVPSAQGNAPASTVMIRVTGIEAR